MKALILTSLLACVVVPAAGAQCDGKRSDDYPHVIDAGKSWLPEPGYAWDYPDTKGNFAVHWQPGKRYSCKGSDVFPNIIASTAEGRWHPAPGYTWANPGPDGRPRPGELQVRWNPRADYWYLDQKLYPNIVAAQEEGSWYPKPGYDWYQRDANGRGILGQYSVYWKPGTGYSDQGVTKWPHIEASGTKEGEWYPAPGYVWANVDEQGKARDLSVRWYPGRAHQFLGRDGWPHIHSDTDEGYWIPDAGYDWANRDDNGKPIRGEAGVLSVALLDRWSKYLEGIQNDGAYPNWPSAPYDAWLARGGRRIYP